MSVPAPGRGRAAIVTGGSSGIGRACALGLAADGYDVTILARSRTKLADVEAEAAECGSTVHAVAADIADGEAMTEAVAEHTARAGRLDVLVSNAGTFFEGSIEATGPTETDSQLEVNLRATHLLVRECLPLLREAGNEHRKALIAITASIAAKRGFGDLAMYSATKAGLVGWAQSAHLELGPAGIQVTAICPGFVETEMVAGTTKQDLMSATSVYEALRFLLRTDPNCMVPEIQLVRPGQWT